MKTLFHFSALGKFRRIFQNNFETFGGQNIEKREPQQQVPEQTPAEKTGKFIPKLAGSLKNIHPIAQDAVNKEISRKFDPEFKNQATAALESQIPQKIS